MTAEQKVKKVFPNAVRIQVGGTKKCNYIYTKPLVPFDPYPRQFLGGSFGDRRRAWAKAATNVTNIAKAKKEAS